MMQEQRTYPQGMRPSRRLRQGGFTLVEVITVIIILGILSVFAASRMGMTDQSARARAEEIRAQFRFIQLKAMKSGNVYGFRSDGANYWGFNSTDSTAAAQRIQLPGESGKQVGLAGKNITAFTGAGAADFTYYFDGYGIPYTSYTSATVNTKLNAQAALVVTTPGGTATLTLNPETGYIP